MELKEKNLGFEELLQVDEKSIFLTKNLRVSTVGSEEYNKNIFVAQWSGFVVLAGCQCY